MPIITKYLSLLILGFGLTVESSFGLNPNTSSLNTTYTGEFAPKIDTLVVEYGDILIRSTPEDSMEVYLNGQSTGLYTPARINVPIGEHTITLRNPWYRDQDRMVTVRKGRLTEVVITMNRLYAIVTVTTNNGGSIFIDEEYKGKTRWAGRVPEGNRLLRVEKQNFHPRDYVIPVLRGRDMRTDLIMSPKRGILDITTEPSGASIDLNGRDYGETPRTIEDLPAGNYMLKLSLPGHTTHLASLNITPDEPIILSVKLASGRVVVINSNPQGASVIINDTLVGKTPLSQTLNFGAHNIFMEKDGFIATGIINVAFGASTNFNFELLKPIDPFLGQMVLVKGGTYRMGDSKGEGTRMDLPPHDVTLDDFYIGRYEVTQAQWRVVMGNNPSHFTGCDNCPVERVSWEDVQQFLTNINLITGKNYRLPTEAEWEYAARGGQQSNGYRYAGGDNINFVAWFNGNSTGKTKPVGTQKPNELGLYDMSGNVWEWCHDWFALYDSSPKTNPKGPNTGDFKVSRGGSWFGYVGGNRVSSRASDDPLNRRSYIGFRVALSVK